MVSAADPVTHGLSVAGLEAPAEAVYRLVLGEGTVSIGRVAEALGLCEREAGDRLEELRAAGLIYRGRIDGRFAAVDPRVSLRAVAERTEAGLTRLRAAIPVLAEVFESRDGADGPDASIRVLVGADAVGAAYSRLEHEAVAEFMAFDRPPHVLAPLNPFEPAVIARGVRWRAVYAAASLDRPGAWDEIGRAIGFGEEARITAELPVKLAIADRRSAIMSTRLDAERPEAILTDSAPLVGLLCDVFEDHWQQAVEIPRTGSGSAAATAGSRGPSGEERALLAFFAAGAKDDVIARELHISPRTVRRRGQLLLRRLGAANRFQAGAQAVRRGWI